MTTLAHLALLLIGGFGALVAAYLWLYPMPREPWERRQKPLPPATPRQISAARSANRYRLPPNIPPPEDTQ